MNNFPDPDSRFDKKMLKGGFDIWQYGSIEFHFEKEELFLIYTDNFKKIAGGPAIHLDKWIFDSATKLNLLTVLAELNKYNIDYKKKTDNLGILVRLKSGVELTFENTDNTEDLSPNEFTMTSFGLVAENANRWQ